MMRRKFLFTLLPPATLALLALLPAMAPAQALFKTRLLSGDPGAPGQYFTIQVDLENNTQDVFRYVYDIAYDSNSIEMTGWRNLMNTKYIYEFNINPHPNDPPSNAGPLAYRRVVETDLSNAVAFSSGPVTQFTFLVKSGAVYPLYIRLRPTVDSAALVPLINNSLLEIPSAFDSSATTALEINKLLDPLLDPAKAAQSEDVNGDGVFDVADVVARLARPLP